MGNGAMREDADITGLTGAGARGIADRTSERRPSSRQLARWLI